MNCYHWQKPLLKKKILFYNVDLPLSNILNTKTIQINNKKYSFRHSILCLGKNFTDKTFINKHVFTHDHKSYVGFLNIVYSTIKLPMKYLHLMDH